MSCLGPSGCNMPESPGSRYFSFVGIYHWQRIWASFHGTITSCYCYCMLYFAIILQLNPDTFETPHTTAYYPPHTCHTSHNASEWHHWSSVFMYPPHFLSQTHTRQSLCILNQKNKLSSFPTFWSTQNNAWYQICDFCKVKVFICIFGQYKCGAGWFYLCWCLFSLIYCLVRITSQILGYRCLDWSFHQAWRSRCFFLS